MNMIRAVLVLGIVAGLYGCKSSAGRDAVFPYYRHDYPVARDQVRSAAADRRHENVVLNNMRLGMAAMADGDLDEAEWALMRAYEYLRSGGVNAPDRVLAATLLYEGVRIWKGEPFEQAMSFYYVAALHAMRGDWENVRAAAANSLFLLQDFKGGDQRNSASFDKIESQFSLGYLMAAMAETLQGRPDDAAPMFDRVRALNPELNRLVETLESGRYNTLLLVDLGRGPRKESYGMDETLIRFSPDGRSVPPPQLAVSVDGYTIDHPSPHSVVDLWTLSQIPRWWSLETSRKARSTVGNVLLIGGAGATGVGMIGGRDEVALAGVAAMLAGAALKATSHADVRHLETLPRCVYMVPLLLEPGEHNVHLRFSSDEASSGTWHDLPAGREGQPAVYYLRMHTGSGLGMPRWPDERRYSVRADQYKAGDKPWILGGRDLTPPGPAIAAGYREAGVLPDITADGLAEIYRREGIVFQTGAPDDAKPGEQWKQYRHVAEGGRVLFEPRPGSHAYQRITRNEHPPYQPTYHKP